MKLSEKLLNKLADGLPPGRQILAEADESAEGWTAALTVDRADTVGCVLWELALQRRAGEPLDAAALKSHSERLAGSVKGLLEPLKLLEVDELRREALMRSDGPTRRGQDVYYYEVKLRADNSLTLRRFRASMEPATKRDQVPFTLTHEAIGRVVDDLTA
jgi:hypothetical protein